MFTWVYTLLPSSDCYFYWWANRFFSTWFHLSEQRITWRALCTHVYMFICLFDFMLFNLYIWVCVRFPSFQCAVQLLLSAHRYSAQLAIELDCVHFEPLFFIFNWFSSPFVHHRRSEIPQKTFCDILPNFISFSSSSFRLGFFSYKSACSYQSMRRNIFSRFFEILFLSIF